MNDKNNEAFDEWFIKTYRYDYKDLVIPESINPQKEAWQAACSHKQKEIDAIKAEIERLQNYVIADGYRQKELDELRLQYDKLTDWASEYVAENARLNQEIEKFKGYLEAWGKDE